MLAVTLTTTSLFSHPAPTDSSGGHRDKENKSGLGRYHYHHGYGPHLHADGKCPYLKPKKVKVKSVEISSDDVFVAVNDTVLVKVNILPENAENKTLTWNSSNSTIVDVDEKGNIIGKSKGVTLVTARSKNGRSDAVKVTVY